MYSNRLCAPLLAWAWRCPQVPLYGVDESGPLLFPPRQYGIDSFCQRYAPLSCVINDTELMNHGVSLLVVWIGCP